MSTIDSGSTSSTPIFSPPPSSTALLSQAHHYITLKLTSTNYLLWRTQIDPYLQGQRLFGYVTGELSRPPSFLPSTSSSTDSAVSSSPNPAADSWDAQDKLLMILLISSLSEDVIPLAIGLTSSAEIWSTLSAAFASPSNTRVLRLSMELHTPQKHDETLSVFLHRLKRISDELSASARPISSSDFMVAVLKGLRPEFISLKSALSMLDTPLPFSVLLSKCLSHEFLTEPTLTVEPPAPPPSANTVQRFPNTASHSNNYRGRTVVHVVVGEGISVHPILSIRHISPSHVVCSVVVPIMTRTGAIFVLT